MKLTYVTLEEKTNKLENSVLNAYVGAYPHDREPSIGKLNVFSGISVPQESGNVQCENVKQTVQDSLTPVYDMNMGKMLK